MPGAPTKPDSNILFAILSTVFCFLPFGLVAILCAVRVNRLWQKGDVVGAQNNARWAARWSIYAAVAGVVVLLYALIRAVALASR